MSAVQDNLARAIVAKKELSIATGQKLRANAGFVPAVVVVTGIEGLSRQPIGFAWGQGRQDDRRPCICLRERLESIEGRHLGYGMRHSYLSLDHDLARPAYLDSETSRSR